MFSKHEAGLQKKLSTFASERKAFEEQMRMSESDRGRLEALRNFEARADEGTKRAILEAGGLIPYLQNLSSSHALTTAATTTASITAKRQPRNPPGTRWAMS